MSDEVKLVPAAPGTYLLVASDDGVYARPLVAWRTVWTDESDYVVEPVSIGGREEYFPWCMYDPINDCYWAGPHSPSELSPVKTRGEAEELLRKALAQEQQSKRVM